MPRLLEARSGLSRHTVLEGLARLESSGWLSGGAHPRSPSAYMPTDLLRDRRVHAQPKLLYASLQLLPGFRRPGGQFTYRDLSDLTCLSRNTVKRAVRILCETGWLELSQQNQLRPVSFALRNPAAERSRAAVATARRRLINSTFFGEALMREYLSLLIDSDQYDDDASPAFLVNPATGEELEFDRYYPPDVAFEFNGPQHYAPTARYPNEEDAKQQRVRDYIKLGICAERGIRLVVVHSEDLSLASMRRKVEGLLPLRDLEDQEPLIAYLEDAGRAYRQQPQKGWTTVRRRAPAHTR